MCWLCCLLAVKRLMLGLSAPCPLKVCVVSSSRPQSPDQLFSRQASETSASPRTSDSSMVPVADFDYPPEFSSCLDNSAAKHKLLVKPRNQRSSKMRRLSSVTGQRQGGQAPSTQTPCSFLAGSPSSEPPPTPVGPMICGTMTRLQKLGVLGVSTPLPTKTVIYLFGHSFYNTCQEPAVSHGAPPSHCLQCDVHTAGLAQPGPARLPPPVLTEHVLTSFLLLELTRLSPIPGLRTCCCIPCLGNPLFSPWEDGLLGPPYEVPPEHPVESSPPPITVGTFSMALPTHRCDLCKWRHLGFAGG